MPSLLLKLLVGRRLVLLRVALWFFAVVVLLAGSVQILRWHVADSIAKDQAAELQRIESVRSDIVGALSALHATTGDPCSPEFFAQMREVAFLPDGLNEFLYAPGGKVSCSVDGSKFDPPIDLGAEDIPSKGPRAPSWRLSRDFSALRHPGVGGTIAQLGNFAVAVPPYSGLDRSADWHIKELVARSEEGLAWTVAGHSGLYRRIAAANGSSPSPFTAVATTCSPKSVFCISSRADLLAWARGRKAELALGLCAITLLAWILADAIASWIRWHWSFVQRFRRGLNSDSLILNYQPIVNLASGKVVSVEVLARWRDYDGRIVSPNQFLSLLVQFNRTRPFTQMVIERAYAELTTLAERGVPLRVNFNVFPSDFESSLILGWLAKFRQDPRLAAAIELVEDGDLYVENTRRCIETMAAAGIPTFIDDFGTGYSSIERVARMPVQGVKLDRSFAMAPPDSVLGQMLIPVVEMMRMTGRKVVVEGVESRQLLDKLRSTGMVDCVQGFLISTPMPIDALRAFMARSPFDWASASAAA